MAATTGRPLADARSRLGGTAVAIGGGTDGGYVDVPDVERAALAGVTDPRLVIVAGEDFTELLALRCSCLILWHRVTLPATFFELNETCRVVICASVGY